MLVAGPRQPALRSSPATTSCWHAPVTETISRTGPSCGSDWSGCCGGCGCGFCATDAEAKAMDRPAVDNRTRNSPALMSRILSFPPEQFLDVGMGELHPGWAAVVALAAMGGDLHLAQQGVHLGDREQTAGADGAVAGHGRSDMVEPFLQGQRLVEGGELVGEVGDQAPDVTGAEHGRGGPDEDRLRAEAFQLEAHFGELGDARLDPVAAGL